MIELWQFEECPYCIKVRETLNDLKLDFIVVSVPKHAIEKRKILEMLGGKVQVPFLVDRDKGVMMYESDDIVAYLEREYGD